MANVDADRDYLKQEKVMEHLGQIVDRVIAEKPKDAYALVEVLSRLVKDEQPNSLKVKTCGASAPEPTPEEAEAVAQYVKKTRQLDAVPKDEGGEIVTVAGMADFVEESELLSWAGAGFSQIESYKIMCSMRSLAQKQADAGIAKLRFWGKILGTAADYYVAEATRGEGDELPEVAEGDDPYEAPGGPGVNQYTYYVTNDLAGDWQKLPHLHPRDIVAARSIKRILSGDLKAKVITHPFFNGTEDTLLRAQIARINSDTTLCIKGYFIRDEEETEIDLNVANPNEEFEKQIPPPSDMLKAESWMHMQTHILKHGSTTHKDLPEIDEENEQEVKMLKNLKEKREADPAKDVIRGLTADGLQWTIKQAGDATVYGTQATCVTYVRSLTWPGAVCAARGAKFVNCYVGYGLPAGEPDFFPPAPPDVQDEPADDGEQLQPPGTEEDEAPPADE